MGINIQKIIYISFTAEGCPSFSVTNGKVLGINTQKGSSVQVKCSDGYKLKSQEYLFRKCQDNGHWSGTGGNGAVVECLSKFLLYFGLLLQHGTFFVPLNIFKYIFFKLKFAFWSIKDVIGFFQQHFIHYWYFTLTVENILIFIKIRNPLWCTTFDRWSEGQINKRWWVARFSILFLSGSSVS